MPAAPERPDARLPSRAEGRRGRRPPPPAHRRPAAGGRAPGRARHPELAPPPRTRRALPRGGRGGALVLLPAGGRGGGPRGFAAGGAGTAKGEAPPPPGRPPAD